MHAFYCQIHTRKLTCFFFLKGISEHTQVGQRGGQIDSTAPVEVFGELRS